MKLSVIVPMYNEAAVVEGNVKEIVETLEGGKRQWELVLVDDGSKDDTGALMDGIVKKDGRVIAVHHPFNRGRGAAIKTGFANSKGDVLIVLDADLSYSPAIINDFVDSLERTGADIVLASYRKAGRPVNVPFFRVFLSDVGNRVLSYAIDPKLTVVTCSVRAYRRKVIESLDLVADDKELHLEILSKALDLGYRITEIPAVLKWREHKIGKAQEKRKSKFPLKNIMWSHLLFTFGEAPILLVGGISLLFVLGGTAIGLYIAMLWLGGELGSMDRPITTLMVIFYIVGVQCGLFWFLGNQNRELRRQLVRMERDVLELKSRR